MNRIRHWLQQRRLHWIETELEMLRMEVEEIHLRVNSLIREKAAIEIEQAKSGMIS